MWHVYPRSTILDFSFECLGDWNFRGSWNTNVPRTIGCEGVWGKQLYGIRLQSGFGGFAGLFWYSYLESWHVSINQWNSGLKYSEGHGAILPFCSYDLHVQIPGLPLMDWPHKRKNTSKSAMHIVPCPHDPGCGTHHRHEPHWSCFSSQAGVINFIQFS